MTLRVVGRWIGRIGVWVPATLVLLGCPEDPHKITNPASDPAFNFPVTSAFSQPVSPFAIDRLTIADIDTSVTDAFGRVRSFNTAPPDFISFVSGCGLPNTTRCPGREFPIRNVNADNRLPTLQDPDAAALLGVVADSVFGVPLLLLSVANLLPSTVYTVTLERLALTRNEGLDVPNILLNSPVFGGFALSPDAADALTPLGGTPGTTLGSNPYEIATITTDAGGAGFFTPGFAGSDANLETNDVEAFDLPNYNYLVVYLGVPSAGVPVLRAQIGVDLDAAGNLINNTLAPFPTAAYTVPQMIAAPGGAGRPDSLNVTFNQLEALTGAARYEAWLVNPGTGDMLPAIGRYNLFQIIATRDPITNEIVSTRDSLVDSIPSTASFLGANTGDGFRHQLVLSDATLGSGPADSIGFYTHVMLTIDETPGDATPSNTRPFWFEFTNQSATPTNFFDDAFSFEGTATFGVFDATNPAASLPFGGQGRGEGGIRENVLSVDLENVSRPPVGYSLVAWLTAEGLSPVRFQDITGPLPEAVSLVDADVTPVPGLVTATGILEANLRLLQDAAGINFGDYSGFVVTVEPKQGDAAMGALQVLVGALPQ